MDNIESAVKEFAEVLDELKISYAIGGSMASSIYGRVRFTQDADISVEAFTKQIDKFCESVESSFYVSKEAVKQAHKNASGFNLIYLDSIFKIDVFVVSDDPFKKQIFARRRKLALEENSDKRYDFVSPEDIVLLKLQWYSHGGAVSEKQWNDIIGVIQTQQGSLDMDYMLKWASELSVLELFHKAIQETTN